MYLNYIFMYFGYILQEMNIKLFSIQTNECTDGFVHGQSTFYLIKLVVKSFPWLALVLAT